MFLDKPLAKRLSLIIGIMVAIFLVLYLKAPLKAQRLGGPCEGCEALLEYGDQRLSATDTLPGFEKEADQLLVTGIVYEADGQTPAAGVIIYAYHTNTGGTYPTRGNETGWARRHGYIRGWVKTGTDGRYSFYTFKPGTYPNRREPAHIHLTVKEPGKTEYYIDSIEFDDDPLLTAEKRAKHRKRGGSGIVNLNQKESKLYCQRDIYLGKNIPNYSK